MSDPKWEWVDTVFGLIVGVFTAIIGMLGWINPKLTKIDDRHQKTRDDLDDKIDEVHARVTSVVEDTATLMAHHESHRERLQSIDTKLGRIEQHLMNLRR